MSKLNDEVVKAVRGIAGDRADDILQALENGGEGAVMISVLGKLSEPETKPEDPGFVPLHSLSRSEATAALTKAVLGLTLNDASALDDLYIKKS